jgi:hypothetical protein
VGTRAIKRGKASQLVDGKDFRLADEIRYIQEKAADHTLRMVTFGQLILFSTETGDAWLLEVTDKLAARLARMGTLNQFTWRRPIPVSPSAGRASIVLKTTPLSTLIARLAASPPSSAIPQKRSLNRADLKISNMFA